MRSFYYQQSQKKLHGIRVEHGAAASVEILFLGGYMSDINGTKAQALARYCQENIINYTAFDYSGHGQSSGSLLTATVSLWVQEALDIIQHMIHKPCIIVGSSLGGWIMMRLIEEQPQIFCAAIGLAPAPDFTQQLIEKNLTVQEKQDLEQKGHILQDSGYDEPYVFTRSFLKDGRRNKVLKPHTISFPMHLLYGTNDRVIPFSLIETLFSYLQGDEVYLHYLKGADHGLSRPQDLALLFQLLEFYWNTSKPMLHSKEK